MKLAVLFYRDTDNPKGFPGDYPAKCMEVEDDFNPEAPWVLVDPDAYRAAIDRLSDQVSAINDQWEIDHPEVSTPIFIPDVVVSSQDNAEAKVEVEKIETHLDKVDAGTATDKQRLEVVDTLASLLVKYAPILASLAKQSEASTP